MRYGYLGMLLAVAPVAMGGCSDQPSQKRPPDKLVEAVAPDIADGWQWSKAELDEATKRAESGDMEAANRLFAYYSVHQDQEKSAYWQDWLFKRGDPGAIEFRAHSLFTSSRERAFGDPRKLTELREAERLWLSVHKAPSDNPFLDKIQTEIAAAENAPRD